MRRRQLLCALPFSAGLAAQTCVANATAKPLTLVVPFVPGASVDLLSRLLAREVTRVTGIAAIVDNRPGANGIVGAEFVKGAVADGKTLYIANVGSHAINASLYGKRLPYDAFKDFAPISLLWRFPSVLAVPAASAARDVAELVKQAQRKSQGVTYASAGGGSGGHLLGEMLRAASGAPMIHVPYKGAAPAVIDLIGGRVDCFFVSYSSIQKQVEQGLIRVLAVAGDKRLNVLPQVPTMREVGFSSVQLDNWFGLVAPARTPISEISFLHEKFSDALKNAKVKSVMEEQGVEAISCTPAEFAELMKRDTQRLGLIVKSIGAKAD